MPDHGTPVSGNRTPLRDMVDGHRRFATELERSGTMDFGSNPAATN
jgi:hypothetical protein